jgi:hypothetical protein
MNFHIKNIVGPKIVEFEIEKNGNEMKDEG